MHGIKLDGRWCANISEYENDIDKQYDWVYLVDSMGYTRFEKTDNVKDEIKRKSLENGFVPFMAFDNSKRVNVEVVGQCSDLTWDKKVKYIIGCDNLVIYGIHSDCIEKIE